MGALVASWRNSGRLRICQRTASLWVYCYSHSAVDRVRVWCDEAHSRRPDRQTF